MEASEPALAKKRIKMVEFFSGIGGMRYAVEKALQGENDISPVSNISKKTSPLLSCKAYEISQYANITYARNFKDAPIASKKRKRGKNTKEPAFSVTTKLIEQLKPEDFDSADMNIADLWTMSPPCQPFTNTKNAKQRDSDDERCKGFKAIISLLKSIENKPRFIMLENVKCFIGSHMLTLWQACLRECGYTWEEYILSPMQFGIPNHRTRYYMICERSDRFSSDVRQKNNFELSCLSTDITSTKANNIGKASDQEVKAVSNYIDEIGETDIDKFLIPDDVFEKKWAKDMPVVSPFDRVTHCFTAGYSRQIHKSTGSLLLLEPGRTESVAEVPIDRSDMMKFKGKLRKFTPTELLRIFGFPSVDFFPEEITLAHQYKLVGNSVNVTVVSYLASILLKEFVINK